MDKETLAKINSFTRREFKEEELYVFPITLCDNEIDRDLERFSDAALEKMQQLFIGKTGIFDHDPTANNQEARVFDTKVVTDNSRTTKDGRPYKYLKGMAYMVRTDANKDLISEIDAGIKKEVSVSCSAAKTTCSICGADVRHGVCDHIKGKEYDGKICHHILDDITDAYEWSFVAVPAQINAGVTKKYEKGGKAMETFTPITTQEQLDSVVQERVAAAVEEAKKGFEGWLSPEDAATLTQERDDSRAEVADLTAKNAAAENRVLKMQIATEKGIPFELAERLNGSTKEEISADADKLSKYFNTQKVKPTPSSSGETGFADAMTTAKLEMLHELNN